jgi:uncharacterized protein involved in exopolysaccharide biosynthesis
MERLIDKPISARAEITKIPRLLLAHRRHIFGVTLVVLLIAAAINFLEPNYYVSGGSLLPTGNQGPGAALGSLASAIPGIELMKSDPDPTASSQLFPDILKSDVVRKRVLATELPPEIALAVQGSTVGAAISSNSVKALNDLTSATTVRKDKATGVISIGFEWTDPEFAQFVAAEYIKQLDTFCSSERFARLDENRSFVQSRLQETQVRLRDAEDTLLLYREQNRNYYLGSAPELQLEHERLMRKVAEIGEVYSLLSQQLEMATIEAKRKKPVVAVLDYPSVPVEKAGPHRLTNVMQITLAALLLSCGAIVVGNYVRNYISPEELQQIEQMRDSIGSRVATMRNSITLRRKIEV